MKNRWTTRSLSENSPLLQRIGAKPGTYDIMCDTSAKVIRIKGYGQEWTIPFASAIDAMSLLNQNGISNNSNKDSAWYPGANHWEDKGSYQIKHRFDDNGKCTDILIARSGLSRTKADKEHIHIYKIGENDQGNIFKDDQGKIHNLSDYDIRQILAGARPLL